MTARFGNAPEAGRRYTRRPGVYAILQDGPDLLVTHQAYPMPEFQLPGGGIDPGEPPLRALRREVMEETGWHITSPRRLGAFRCFTFMPEYDLWAEKVCIIYRARPVRPLALPSEPGHTAIWMPAKVAADQLGNPGDRHFVARHCR